MSIRIGYLILTLACWQSPDLHAQGKNLSLCDMPSNTCLNWVNKALKNEPPYTLQWYNFKLLQLDSLITIKEFKTLKQQLRALNKNIKHPEVFLTHLNIYQAKLHIIDGNEQQAKTLLHLSLEDLEQLNQAFYSPMRMINIANLMLDLQQYTQSLDLLEQIKTDFADSRDLYLKLELYGNLGHANRFLNMHAQALTYYKTSLQFALELGVEQQISVLHTHVGNMYLATSQAKLAETHYIQALDYAEKGAREATVTDAKIYLAWFYLQQIQWDKARSLTQDINEVDLQPHQQKEWLAINAALSKASNDHK